MNPLAITDGEVRESLFQMAQSITTQTQAITTQANREVAPRENQHASTMASCLRDFVKMNPPMYFGSKVNEDPQDFVDKVYKFCLLWDNRDLGDGHMTWEILKKGLC